MEQTRTLQIELLSDKDFQPYGEIITPAKGNLFIDYPDGSAFHVLAAAKSGGWRLAALRLRTRNISDLQVHRTTAETLHPIHGVAVLCVNTRPSYDGLRAFILDRAVLLHANVWHNVMTLSEESLIEIAENDQVDCEEVRLERELVAGLREAPPT